MKRFIPLLLIAAMLLTACGTENASPTETSPEAVTGSAPESTVPFESDFGSETLITLSDEGIDAKGPNSLFVFASNDIVYYEEKTEYESGNPYGEGEESDMHSADEAAAHTVVNITAPGAYRVTGKLSAGQIRIDLGEDAYDDEKAVVELILDNADITCTVAPAILFQNVYECDGDWDADTATSQVDTSAAGANLILEGENTVHGSYVAKIFKDKDGEKKLWKQDGAIYSYMSLNVFGPGSLDLTAENEGLDTELHLTVNGGDITIRSDNDGINTNEDGVSVTTINAGSLHIIAGLGAEGDGIDSNGYLVINGGHVVSSANPASDAGLDSDLGSYINGGTVIALGASMDWAESDSNQVTMNLQYASYQSGDSAIQVTLEDGTEVFAFDPAGDPILAEHLRQYQGAIISCPEFTQGDSYHVYTGGEQMMYTGTDVIQHFGHAMGSGPAPLPGTPGPDSGNFGPHPADGVIGDNFPGGKDEPPVYERPVEPEPPAEPMGGNPGAIAEKPGKIDIPDDGNTLFFMQDKVNFFSGLTPAA
ncbi:MAG: carbohydrate-binding domain-containing protein [Oscillospiraceae bacterium]|nr:carbohydrate-binding domain-containing protein [Oscillospiraceae bacterium]